MSPAAECKTLAVFLAWLLASALAHAGAPQQKAVEKKIDEKTIQALIQQLGDDALEKRDGADKRLAEIGEPALKLLETAAQKSGDPEVRARAGDLVRVIGRMFLRELRRFDGHTHDNRASATRIAVCPDGKHVVTGGSGMLRYWELETGKELAAFGPVPGSSYYALSLSKDGKRVIAGGGDRIVRVFDLPTGKPVQEFTGHKDLIGGAVLLHDGKRAISAGFDFLIRVWDIETGAELRTFDAIGASTRSLALSADGKVLAAAQCPAIDNSAGVARLWDIETGKVIRTFEGHAMNTTSVAFSPDGEKLLASGYDGDIRVWDIKTGKLLRLLKGAPQGIAMATFTGDGRRVVAAGQHRIPTLRVWDIASGKMIVESDALRGAVFGVAALADPQRFLSASTDGIIRVWRLKR